MLVENRLILIDNGLCGPGPPESTLRGYHPSWEEFSAGHRLEKCHYSKGSFVAFVFRDTALPHGFFASPPVLARITRIEDDTLRTVAAYCNVEPRVADVLIDRRNTVITDYQDWFRQVPALFGGDSPTCQVAGWS